MKSEHHIPNTFYLSLVTIDRQSEKSLYRQIIDGIKTAVRDERLAPGTKLPSTRDLASIWGVSRNTIRNAFEQLIAEGYLDALVGKGTFVLGPPKAIPSRSEGESAGDRPRPLSQIGQFMERFGRRPTNLGQPPTAFTVGVPDYSDFPHKIWMRILNRCQRRMHRERRLQTPPNGLPALRQAIAAHLVSARGLRCTAEQIDIVPGAISGMLIALHALLDPGDQAWMENPGFKNVFGLLRYRGAQVIPVPVDEEGLDVGLGMAQAPEARLAYVTPSHQFPLGVTMSMGRRRQLLDWAAEQGAWILEDDYDSDFRYEGQPLPALQGLDENQRVIYCGSFSKVIMPGIRLGYLVLPPDLVAVHTGVKLPMSVYSPALIQEAVAEFMLEGHFVRHIRRMRRSYGARRDALVEALERHMGGAVCLGAHDCGMHMVVYLLEGLDEQEVVRQGRRLGMAIQPLSADYLAPPEKQGFLIGFSNVAVEEIEPYIARLAKSVL